ncbi:LysE family translocator [Bacterioplanoides sp.]|uniref:LysE family translocator n=1 Tax=Bacterioplanoides sp. TaxID=2066072 RepID=UPI003B5D0443
MSFSLIFSMSAFALAASVSPGPVNLVGLSSGGRYPLRFGLIFVSGATVGFLLLFILVGLGLSNLFEKLPVFYQWLRWAGVAFLLSLSWMLFRSGDVVHTEDAAIPGFWTGFLMQWLNPKAWLASAAGISAYAQTSQDFWLFTLLYGPICWLSLSCWVLAGAYFRRWLQQPGRIKRFNRVLSLLLFISAVASLGPVNTI